LAGFRERGNGTAAAKAAGGFRRSAPALPPAWRRGCLHCGRFAASPPTPASCARCSTAPRRQRRSAWRSAGAETTEIEGGCVATVEADVTATLKPSEMISTATIVYHPDYSLWSKGWKLKTTYQSFSRSAIEICEQTMKSFVNDGRRPKLYRRRP
jgi:hypothetical protein